jgi:hypothetical protein
MNAVDEYIRMADSWGAALENEDSDTANALYDQIMDMYQHLCQTGQENALFDRVANVGDAACFWIAGHLKKKDRLKAIKVYDRLTRSPYPFLSLSAEYILKELAERDA